MTLVSFIKSRKHLFWYIKEPSAVSLESVVEHILNYGDFKDVKLMFKIVGLKETAVIFAKQCRKKRCNYRPEIKNYFKLYFKKYV